LIHHDDAARFPAGWSASFFSFQVRQNIQTAVPRMMMAETSCSHGSADSAVKRLLMYIPPKAISQTMAVCERVAASHGSLSGRAFDGNDEGRHHRF
jgi:hypothetical protein